MLAGDDYAMILLKHIIYGALYFGEKEAMLRRVTQREGFDAFEDRLGNPEAKKKRKFRGKKLQVTDEVEEKLETLVFGKLPFQAVGEGSKALSEVRTLC